MSVFLINKPLASMSNPIHQITTRPTNTKKLLFETIYCFGRGIMIHQTENFGIRVLRNPTPKELEKKLGRKATKLIPTNIGFSACILS